MVVFFHAATQRLLPIEQEDNGTRAPRECIEVILDVLKTFFSLLGRGQSITSPGVSNFKAGSPLIRSPARNASKKRPATLPGNVSGHYFPFHEALPGFGLPMTSRESMPGVYF
jgi:hypothetical protein